MRLLADLLEERAKIAGLIRLSVDNLESRPAASRHYLDQLEELFINDLFKLPTLKPYPSPNIFSIIWWVFRNRKVLLTEDWSVPLRLNAAKANRISATEEK